MLDQELIKFIQNGASAREKALKHIYTESNLKRNILQLIKSNNGTDQDGEDMFQEGIIVLDRNIRNNAFRGESSIASYLTSICKLLWMNELRKNKRIDLKDDHQVFDNPVTENALNTLINEELILTLNKVFSLLGERCKKVLELWKLNYSMQEIADEVGLSSEAMARKTKHQCFKQLLEFVKENSVLNNYKNR